MIEVFLAGWAMSRDSPTSNADVRTKALIACKHARRAARASPVCQPQLLLLRGRIALLSGRRSRARDFGSKPGARQGP